MTGLNNDVDILKDQMNKLMAKLTPEQRKIARDAIDRMREATTPEELNRMKDEEIEKLSELSK